VYTTCGVRAARGRAARQGAKPVAQIAGDLGMSESCLRNWMAQVGADVNDNPA